MLQSSRRPLPRGVPLAVLGALVATLLAVGPTRAPVHAEDVTLIHSPAPAPGEVVDARAGEVRVQVRSARPIVDAELHVDGRRVEAAAQLASLPDGTAVAVPLTFESGMRHLRLDVIDDAGRRTGRDWTVTATERVVERHAGRDRVQTAVVVSRATFAADGRAPAAVLARADDFADALAGAPLAAAVEGPLLLSHRTALPEVVADELARALAPGGTVHLLGGTAAIGPEVADALAEAGWRVRRHAGRDRFATAAAIAAELPPATGAILASGTSFPDALAASAPAARDGLPILLTGRDALPEATREALRGRAVVTIAGGTAAVGPAVEQAAGQVAATVRRVSGTDRYATAAAIVAEFYEGSEGVSLASGLAFPDALAGTRHAVAHDQPLLLTAPGSLPTATARAIGVLGPQRVTIYGGQSAVSDGAASAARRAALDGPGGPGVLSTVPRAYATLPHLQTVALHFDRPVDVARSSVHVEVGGMEVSGVLRGSGDTLAVDVAAGQRIAAPEERLPGRVVVRAVAHDGGIAHDEVAFTYLEPDPLFATAGPVPLTLPSRIVEMIGFHQSNHPGAQALSARPTATPKTTLASRGRGTSATSAADVVADPAMPVLAPVTGRVIRGGSYVLYCRYTDEYAVIAPDTQPAWEVKVLHVQGLQVGTGDRVVAGQTVIAAGPRQLPFESQVDDQSSTRWPHVHLEVVDPSIPPKPGDGC